jgi:putative DNA primase/helicase
LIEGVPLDGKPSKLGLPALTFGGVGDGLPDGVAPYLAGRHIVVIADNDDAGRTHAERKIRIAQATGAASAKVIHFPELPEKGDVSDFIAGGGTFDDLTTLIDAAPVLAKTVANKIDATNAERSLIIQCASGIEPEPITWLWPSRIARGKHTCIAGEPGTGKSQLSLAIIATITTGGDWPCGEGCAPLGNVIILSAEDGIADTVIPRLQVAGADRNRVHVISAVRSSDGSRKSFNLQNDLYLLEREIARIGDVALVVVDPVSSYLGKTDSHKNSEVRGVLEPLSEMAERMRVAILSITHFSKSGANNTPKALHRFIGSIAFTGAPRAAFAVIEDAEHDGRRLFLHAKNNLAPVPQGLAFRLEQCLINESLVASRVLWDGEPVAITANEALAADATGDEMRTAKADAIEFLRAVLASGPVPAAEVNRMAREHGLTSKVVRSARESLGVTIERDGFGPGSKSLWALPSEGA